MGLRQCQMGSTVNILKLLSRGVGKYTENKTRRMIWPLVPETKETPKTIVLISECTAKTRQFPLNGSTGHASANDEMIDLPMYFLLLRLVLF